MAWAGEPGARSGPVEATPPGSCPSGIISLSRQEHPGSYSVSTLRRCWEQTCAQATDAASQRLPAGCPSPRREFLQLNVLVSRGVSVPLMSQQGRGAAGLLRALLSPRGGLSQPGPRAVPSPPYCTHSSWGARACEWGQQPSWAAPARRGLRQSEKPACPVLPASRAPSPP